MKRRLLASGMAVLLCALTAISETRKADFSGRWILDEEQSTGIPTGTKEFMTITQSGEQLTVATGIYPSGALAYSVKESYMLNGKETAFATEISRQKGIGRRTARWQADGSSIE